MEKSSKPLDNVKKGKVNTEKETVKKRAEKTWSP